MDYTLANNISGGVDLGSHIITGDPRFVDAENEDFRLRANSFLKDKAENEIDLDGNRRVVGGAIDLGAYEYQ